MQAVSEPLLDDLTADKPSADALACENALNAGSKSFHAASLLLPKHFAKDATALYAFCRLTDDLIDNAIEAGNQRNTEPSDSQSDAVMQSLHERLDDLYDGNPYPHPADRALCQVVKQHRLPKALLSSLFEGYAWDAAGRRYETIEDVYAYGARVAGSVGVMMSVLMGARSPHLLARAADLGVAMQLSNIARDVGEDARAGRLYLPREWLREEGIDPDAFVSNPEFSDGLGRVVARLLDAADQLYARADSGIANLPQRFRPGMYAARLLYAEIGHEVRRIGLNSVERRAVVSRARKITVLGGLTKLPFLTGRQLTHRALNETHCLVELVADDDARRAERQPWSEPADSSLAGLSAAGEWVLDLFEELDRRDARTVAMSQKLGNTVIQLPR